MPQFTLTTKKTHTYVSYIFIVIAVAHWDKLALQWCIYSQSDMELSYYTLYNVYVDYWQVYKIADFFSPCVALIRSQHICMCLCEGGNKKIWLSFFNHQFWKCEKKSPIDWLRSRASRSLKMALVYECMSNLIAFKIWPKCNTNIYCQFNKWNEIQKHNRDQHIITLLFRFFPTEKNLVPQFFVASVLKYITLTHPSGGDAQCK